MEELLVFGVSQEEQDLRIDRYLSEKMDNCSRSFVQKLLKDGKVSISGKSVKPSYKVQAGDVIEAFRNRRSFKYCRRTFLWISCMKMRMF